MAPLRRRGGEAEKGSQENILGAPCTTLESTYDTTVELASGSAGGEEEEAFEAVSLWARWGVRSISCFPFSSSHAAGKGIRFVGTTKGDEAAAEGKSASSIVWEGALRFAITSSLEGPTTPTAAVVPPAVVVVVGPSRSLSRSCTRVLLWVEGRLVGLTHAIACDGPSHVRSCGPARRRVCLPPVPSSSSSPSASSSTWKVSSEHALLSDGQAIIVDGDRCGSYVRLK